MRVTSLALRWQEMVFLVGAYARYNWPYVWVRHTKLPCLQVICSTKLAERCWMRRFGSQLRSNHGVATTDKDLPLDLKTTQSWSTRGLRLVPQELKLRPPSP